MLHYWASVGRLQVAAAAAAPRLIRVADSLCLGESALVFTFALVCSVQVGPLSAAGKSSPLLRLPHSTSLTPLMEDLVLIFVLLWAGKSLNHRHARVVADFLGSRQKLWFLTFARGLLC